MRLLRPGGVLRLEIGALGVVLMRIFMFFRGFSWILMVFDGFRIVSLGFLDVLDPKLGWAMIWTGPRWQRISLLTWQRIQRSFGLRFGFSILSEMGCSLQKTQGQTLVYAFLCLC